MQTLVKSVLTFVFFLIFVLIVGAIKDLTGVSNGGPIVGTVLFIGFIAAIRAVWKHKPNSDASNDTTIDKQDLDKH